jgi:hypothetical protein
MTPERPLTVHERTVFAPYFCHEVLEAARIVDGKVPFWLRRDMCAVVLYNRIYLRVGAYQPDTPQGMALLGHELMHVAQYLAGMTVWRYLWSCRHGYRNSPYELQAYAAASRILAGLGA